MGDAEDIADTHDPPELRGEIIGRVVPRTTMRPATRDSRVDSVHPPDFPRVRRDDPRSEGAVPAAEKVRISTVDAIGTAGESPPPSEMDAARKKRVQSLMDDLRRCGPGDESAVLEPLRHLGEAGLEALADAFPGLPWFDRRLPHRKLPKGRHASPICSLFVQLGPASAKHVLALLEDPDPEVRYYAVLVAADLSTPALLGALGERLYDGESAVREVTLQLLSERRDPGPATRAMEERLRSDDCSARDRMLSLTAVGPLRAESCAALLPPFLGWVDDRIASLAHDALRVLTAQDFGKEEKKWRRFFAKHGDEGRFEWLVIALGHRDRELRALAADELRSLSGHELGFDPDMGLWARRRIQKAYRRLGRDGRR